MTKEKFKKIKSNGTFFVDDLTPEEKRDVYAVMEKYGMPQSTAYFRFFRVGFDPWEISGVYKLQREFLLSVFADIDGTGNDEEGTRGYGYVLTLDKNYDDTKFFDICNRLKIGNKLCDFIARRGMKSPVTTRKRFSSADWQPWEVIGLDAIIDEICGDEAAKRANQKTAKNVMNMRQHNEQTTDQQND